MSGAAGYGSGNPSRLLPVGVAEYDDAGTLLRKFVYGPGIDEPICLIDAADANALYYYHCDGLGSVVALCDVNSAPVERYTYDVFGRPTIRNAAGAAIDESAFDNPYLFTGRAYDAETALYYYRARYYDYYTGRFLQPDPIGYGDGLNLYAYVGNNAIGFVDPLGLCKDIVSPEEREKRNRAAADTMKWYYHQSDEDESNRYREYGSFVLRNQRTGELYPSQIYTPGTNQFVDPAQALDDVTVEIKAFPDNYYISAFCHRHGYPDGYMLPQGPAQPNAFSPGDQRYAQNSPGGPIDIYVINRDGDMRFYNPLVHGAPQKGNVPGTGVGNIADWATKEWE